MTTPSSITCAGCDHLLADAALFCPRCGTPRPRPAAASRDPLIGQTLGERFAVIDLIGHGASGTIYRGEHVTIRRRVAIKVLHHELSRDDLAVERFRREATTVAGIDNEHITQIHDFGRTPDGRLYLVMELLDGESLDAVLRRERQLTVERAADVLIQVGEALVEAHALGYVHRDLRPRNIFLAVRRGTANFIKLLDFGLAKIVDGDARAASTSLGMTFGDPRYMSPEQARGDRVDRRADIYQLGCVAYEMLTGTPPFTGERVFEILSSQVTAVPAPLPTRRPGVPLWMEAAVAKMLAKDPDNRFATMTRMIEALRRGLETGAVMGEDVARRRESVPPPSVSRAMEKLGRSAPVDVPPAVPAPTPVSGPVAPRPVAGGKEPPPGQQEGPLPALERQRTGTPKLGVPVNGAPVEAPDARHRLGGQGGASPRDAEGNGAPGASRSGPGASSAWFAEGDRAADDGASESDLAGSAELSPAGGPGARRRRTVLLGALAGACVLAGALALALSRRGHGALTTVAAGRAASRTTVAADVPPGPVVATAGSATLPATPSPAATPAAVGASRRAASGARLPDGDGSTVATSGSGSGGWFDPAALPSPSASTPPTGAPSSGAVASSTSLASPSPVSPPVAPSVAPPPAPLPSSTSTGVSGADGPLDPYGGDGADVPSSSAGGMSAEEQAAQRSSLGQQQLAAGDLGAASASFMKALDLDARNVSALVGSGEIALRQGQLGAAIAQLKRATRLAPRSSHAFTLLGEANLRAGSYEDAADSFKAALQIDPDNGRARDGYNDAQARLPPAVDDEP